MWLNTKLGKKENRVREIEPLYGAAKGFLIFPATNVVFWARIFFSVFCFAQMHSLNYCMIIYYSIYSPCIYTKDQGNFSVAKNAITLLYMGQYYMTSEGGSGKWGCKQIVDNI